MAARTAPISEENQTATVAIPRRKRLAQNICFVALNKNQ
jgi:hypothetical protein